MRLKRRQIKANNNNEKVTVRTFLRNRVRKFEIRAAGQRVRQIVKTSLRTSDDPLNAGSGLKTDQKCYILYYSDIIKAQKTLPTTSKFRIKEQANNTNKSITITTITIYFIYPSLKLKLSFDLIH